MIWIMTTIAVILILGVLYVLSTRCRKAGPQVRKLRPWVYAHRGLHDHALPENSMSAFRAALSAGYGIELDLHLMKDGNLAVIHDSALKRTTGAEGIIEDLTTEDLWQYRLEGTSDIIPTFQEVLELFNGQAPMIIELKPHGKNHNALTEATCKLLEGYKGLYCIESFDPRCLLWLKKNRPDIIRGQLSRNFLKSKEKLPWILKVLLTNQMLNFLTQPDFVAYRFRDRKHLSNRLVKTLWGAARVTWTVSTPEDYRAAKKEGWISIFENFTP